MESNKEILERILMVLKQNQQIFDQLNKLLIYHEMGSVGLQTQINKSYALTKDVEKLILGDELGKKKND